MKESKKPTKDSIRAELWRRGELKFKTITHPVQQEMYEKYHAAGPRSILVWLLARQSGKSYLLGILALEAALRAPHSIVKLVTSTKISVKHIFEKIFVALLEDCPEDLKPKYKATEFTYYFANGSQIQMAGSDGKNYVRLRGQKSQLILVDEAGFCDDLDDMIKSVLLPTMTHTDGKIILASTPPDNEEHEFLPYIEEAEFKKMLTIKTLFDNPLLSDERKNQIISDMGGVHTERFRREYLCHLIKSTSTSVIPEFNADLEKHVVKDWPVPPFRHTYVSMDLGFHDLTAVLFAYYDFRAGKIIIEDELVFKFNEADQTIKTLAEKINSKESDLWKNHLSGEINSPNLRVSDVDPIVIKELYAISNGKLNFMTSRKDDKEAAVNNVRVLLGNKRIIISPRCETLIRHLKNVRWHKTKNEFARSRDDSHYDFVDALIYLCRNIEDKKNPYPPGYDLNLSPGDAFMVNPRNINNNSSIDVYRRLLGPKKGRS